MIAAIGSLKFLSNTAHAIIIWKEKTIFPGLTGKGCCMMNYNEWKQETGGLEPSPCMMFTSHPVPISYEL